MASVAGKIKETIATPKHTSWAYFQKRYLTREDGYKYEWLNGIVEKTEQTMTPLQFFILENLQNFFFRLKFEGKTTGQLVQEGDIFFLENHRKPDLAYVSIEQIRAAKQEANPLPKFIIEIISKTDNINRVTKKVENYFAAGVQILWHIFPEEHIVHVYENKELMRIRRGNDLCSAEPVIPGFVISVNDIFKAP